MNDKTGNGARDHMKLTCPCCGAGLGLRADNGSARLELEGSAALTFAPGTMFIDTHAHMIARTTDDYQAMARAGVVAVIEPAFWLGQPRTTVGSYVDYLSTIIGFERFRAGQFGVRHYCCVGLNPKEANNQALAEAVLEILPHFATKEGVVAIGELGYDEQTELEDKYLRAQIELAREVELPIMIHTPHRD
jgi:predicted metal-dependent TIM-barrel fold hydrolase